MTISDQQDKDSLALARLTIILDKSTSAHVGQAPNDAELAALYENQLADIRRAQIISHIANNNAIYKRWMSFIDALSYIDEIDTDTSDETSKVTDKKSLLEKINDFFTPKTMSVFGGGFASAAIALFVIVALALNDIVNISQGLGEAYMDWGSSLNNEWAQAPDAIKPGSSEKFSSSRRFTFKPVDKSEPRKVIETGFKNGSAKIANYPYKAFKINPDTLTSITANQLTELPAENYTLYYNTGRLAALTTIQCTLDPSSDRVNSLHTIASSIVDGLKNTSVSEIKPLTSNFATTEDKAKAVCDLSANIMNYLVTSPATKANN